MGENTKYGKRLRLFSVAGFVGIVSVLHNVFCLVGGRGRHGQLPGNETPVSLIK